MESVTNLLIYQKAILLPKMTVTKLRNINNNSYRDQILFIY